MSPDLPDATNRSTLPDHKSQIWGAAIELPRVKVKKGSGAHVNVAMSVGAARSLSALNAALQHSRGDRANKQNNAREIAWEGPGKLLRSAPFLLRNSPEGIQACVGNGRLEHGYGVGGTMGGRTECRGKFEDRMWRGFISAWSDRPRMWHSHGTSGVETWSAPRRQAWDCKSLVSLVTFDNSQYVALRNLWYTHLHALGRV